MKKKTINQPVSGRGTLRQGRKPRIVRAELKQVPRNETATSLLRVIFIEVAYFLVSHAVEHVLG